MPDLIWRQRVDTSSWEEVLSGLSPRKDLQENRNSGSKVWEGLVVDGELPRVTVKAKGKVDLHNLSGIGISWARLEEA
jgi:hypothetical protein